MFLYVIIRQLCYHAEAAELVLGFLAPQSVVATSRAAFVSE